MEPKELALEIAKAADDKKAFDIDILDLGALSDSFDYFVIASCNNNRQVDAVVDEIENKLRDGFDVRAHSIEGQRTSQWTCMDFGSVIAHIFLPEGREYYRLEHLWGDAERTRYEGEEEREEE